MSTHSMTCICKDCFEKKNKDSFDMYHEQYGVFSITMEYLTRQGLIEHISKTVCPYCKSPNWYLTDSCNR